MYYKHIMHTILHLNIYYIYYFLSGTKRLTINILHNNIFIEWDNNIFTLFIILVGLTK